MDVAYNLKLKFEQKFMILTVAINTLYVNKMILCGVKVNTLQ